MIQVRFWERSLTVTGHAGTAPHGEDLVCAAVSILVYTLASRLYEIEDRMEAKGDPFEAIISLEPGNAKLKWSRETVEVKLLIHTIQTGLVLLMEKHPENIRIELPGEG